jgi:glycosyltransferase involved in cell wall biosynthesis
MRKITPLILTYNERPNIRRALSRLHWAREILVVDSFSTDGTCEVLSELPQVRLIQRQFDNHTSQWNFGLDQVQSDWVLSLDADYVLSDEFVEELETRRSETGTVAYFARFRYCILGRPLRTSLYPPRAVLFRRDLCRYIDVGHTQVLEVSGPTRFFKNPIYHDDRKSLDRWLREQDRYAIKDAQFLLETPVKELKLPDRLRRKIVIAPVLVFFYTLLVKGLIADGLPGWFYVLQRTYAEALLSLRLLETRMRSRTS